MNLDPVDNPFSFAGIPTTRPRNPDANAGFLAYQKSTPLIAEFHETFPSVEAKIPSCLAIMVACLEALGLLLSLFHDRLGLDA